MNSYYTYNTYNSYNIYFTHKKKPPRRVALNEFYFR